jgi:hypothetical protein
MFNGAWVGTLVARGVGVEVTNMLVSKLFASQAVTLPLQYVGFVGAAYYASAAVATKLWSPLVRRPGFGRRWAFVAAGALHALFLLGFAGWAAAFPAPANPDDASVEYHNQSGDPALLLPGRVDLSFGIPAFLVGAIIYAVGDGVFVPQIRATLQTFWSDGKDAGCAMAATSFYTAIGFSLQAAISISLNGGLVEVQLLALAGVLGASCVSLWWLHTHIQSVDASTMRNNAAPPETSSSAEIETPANAAATAPSAAPDLHHAEVAGTKADTTKIDKEDDSPARSVPGEQVGNGASPWQSQGWSPENSQDST